MFTAASYVCLKMFCPSFPPLIRELGSLSGSHGSSKARSIFANRKVRNPCHQYNIEKLLKGLGVIWMLMANSYAILLFLLIVSFNYNHMNQNRIIFTNITLR